MLNSRARAVFLSASPVLLAALLFRLSPLSVGTGRVELAYPYMLAAILALPMLPKLIWQAERNPSWSARVAGVLAMMTVVLSLSGPRWVHPTPGIHGTVLVDVSDSVTPADRRRAEDWLDQLRQAAGVDDTLSVVRFAGRASQDDVKQSAAPDLDTQRTNLDTALSRALGVDTAGKPLRMALLSDGVVTDGDPELAVRQVLQRGARLDVVALDASRPPDMGLAGVEMPKSVTSSGKFSVQVLVQSNHEGQAELHVTQLSDGTSLASETVAVGLGQSQVDMILRAPDRAGPARYRFALQPVGEDRRPGNNALETETVVIGPDRSLRVYSQGGGQRALSDALSRAGYPSDGRHARALSPRSADLRPFRLIVLEDLAYADLSAEQGRALLEYVQEGGQVIISAGGDLIGRASQASGPLASLVPADAHDLLAQDEARSALVLLIDASGSMAGEKIELAKSAAVAATQLLDPDDLIEVIGFAGAPTRVVRLQPADSPGRIALDIGRLLPHGGTALMPALSMAREDLSVEAAGLKHVVLLTDGQTDEPGLPRLAQTLRAEGVTLSTVGLGPDVERDLLSSLANLGGGRAHFTADPRAVPRIFMQETSRVRRESERAGRFHMQATTAGGGLREVLNRGAPPILTYLPLRPRGPGAEVLVRLSSGEPFIIRRRLGLGHTFVLATDVHGSGSAELLRWSHLPQFLGQLITNQPDKHPTSTLPVELTLLPDRALLRVDAPLSGPEAAQLWLGEQGPTAMEQTGPNRFQATVMRGPRLLPVRILLGGGGSGPLEGFSEVPARSEGDLSMVPPDVAFLSQISARTGGKATGTAQEFWRCTPNDPGRGLESRALSPPLLVMALISYLGNIFLRRRAANRAKA